MSNGFEELQRQPTRYGCHGQGIVPATTAGFNGLVDKWDRTNPPARDRQCGGTSGKIHNTACVQGVNYRYPRQQIRTGETIKALVSQSS